jgi:hypothetical protein
VDQEDAAEMPLVILATRRAQKDPEDVTAVPSATSVTSGAQMGHRDVTAVLLAIWSPRGTDGPRNNCSNTHGDLAIKGAQVDPGDAEEVPLAVLTARMAQEDR